ncbi:MAG: TauD/TfdA family dioxygenase [Polyangiales bacterium]
MQHGTLEYRKGMSTREFGEALREVLLKHKVMVASGVDPTVEQRPFWDEVSELAGEVIHIAERPTGEKTGDKWMEIRYDPSIKNAYRHANIAQPMHTDGSYLSNAPDVMFFYCIKQASAGGETTFLDSAELVDILEKKDPALLADLRTTPVRFSKAGDEKTRPIISEDRHGLLLTWNYHCVDPDETPAVKDLAERFHAFLQREVVAEKRALPILLQPGEAVFFHDERLIHGRNAFDAHERNDRFFWKTGFRFAKYHQ